MIPCTRQLPGQFRAELHDRFLAPIYPFAFAALTFAFLGAPRTTRQSRNFSIGGSIFAVFGLRMAGFACSVMTVKTPMAAVDPVRADAGRDRHRPLDHRLRARDRAARRPDRDVQQVACPHAAAVRKAGHRMSMVSNTLGRYFAGRFVVSALGVFASIFVLLVLVDYIEMVRKTSGLAAASPIMVAETSLFRVPQLLEKMMPFCVLIGAMTCYLALSRRLELVVARAAGVSAWQFIAPALASALLLGVLATVGYNPMSANLRELSKRMEAELFGGAPGGGIQDAAGFWINQVNSDGQIIMNAARSEKQGVRLTGLTLFRFDTNNHFKERIEAREATLEEGRWLFKDVRRFSLDAPPVDQPTLDDRDRAHAGAGAQQFFDAGNCVVLATSELHPLVRKFGLRHRRLSAAISQASGTAVFACRDGDGGCIRVVALLPIRRRAKDGFKWRGRGLSALRAVESN